ncbi:MAG: PepSY domain-containing protein [Ramlibacter sp.]|nr:PepSY domain-containing protein [Ramlibacter sp.]
MEHSMRNWHTWGSVALGLPLLLVGLTTIFIAHEKALGTQDILIPGAAAGASVPEVRSSAMVGSEQWIGAAVGVFRLEGNRLTPIDGSPKDEIRGIAAAAGGVLLAGKKGLWRLEGGKAAHVYKGDCWQVGAVQGSYAAACKDSGGLLVSTDGRQWEKRALDFPARLPAGAGAGAGKPLSKIILDVHTGKLFFGKEYEWIWIDLLGLACVGLGITGLTLWMRGRRQRASAAN